MKFAPEGYPFIGFFALAAFAAYAIAGSAAALLFFIVTLFMAYFFRDPERIAPEGDNIFVSPADGKVIVARIAREEQLLKDEAVMISIFMSPLNVHVNRAPCDGTVEQVVHTPGSFISAFKPEASLKNENIAMLMNTKLGKVLVRQIAGFVARRAVCRVRPGAELKKGERYGMIKFSSRLDIFLPKDTEIKVKLGDIVKAGETVIAYRS
ncbi:MAG: phosphatidylserine decarboxylase family protein [Nitrospirae bacterium]|nr:MAG: phosphatidylserine decarboxylase family protein [Nitrospirota bacterium]